MREEEQALGLREVRGELHKAPHHGQNIERSTTEARRLSRDQREAIEQAPAQLLRTTQEDLPEYRAARHGTRSVPACASTVSPGAPQAIFVITDGEHKTEGLTGRA